MGEKESGLAQGAGYGEERRMHEPRDIRPAREAGSGSPGESEGSSGGGGQPAETANLNLSKSNINRAISGDPDFDLIRTSDPAGGMDDDGDGTLDEGLRTMQKTKTKSNQSNDRLAESDPADGTDDESDGPLSIQKNKTKSNQSNDRLAHEDDPAAAAIGGNDIVIGDPGVNG